MTTAPGAGATLAPTWTAPAPGWYADPWQLAPWRWWDGFRWTPFLHGPYYPQLYPHLYPDLQVGPHGERPPKGPGIKGGGIAAIGAGVGAVLSIAVAVAFAATGHDDTENPWFLVANQLALWTGFLGAVFIASRRNGTGSLARDYGLAWPRWVDAKRGVVGGLAGRVPPTVVVVLVLWAADGFTKPNTAAHQVAGVNPEGIAGWAVIVVLTVLGAPFVEELFFRGLLQGAFTRRVGAVSALFVTAVIFSFAHVANEGVFAPIVIFPGALILGYLRYRSGRLAQGMVAHACFNAFAFALLAIPAFR